jgi:hypothetical protein
MDDIVKQAIAKWPHVPDCYGWLGLDARGRWYLRDDAAQAAGPFPQSRGTLLQHEKLIEFIQRNYEPDGQGQWFFQNGPQKVYVELECAPWVWRIESDLSLVSHTGGKAIALDCFQDECGRVYLSSTIGVGLVHTLDIGAVADAVEKGVWSPQTVSSNDLSRQYGFVLSPKGHVKHP